LLRELRLGEPAFAHYGPAIEAREASEGCRVEAPEE
jgi:hypothetical protein